jgi:hypothetical protein
MGATTLKNQNTMTRGAKLFVITAMGVTTQENKKQQ